MFSLSLFLDLAKTIVFLLKLYKLLLYAVDVTSIERRNTVVK